MKHLTSRLCQKLLSFAPPCPRAFGRVIGNAITITVLQAIIQEGVKSLGYTYGKKTEH